MPPSNSHPSRSRQTHFCSPYAKCRSTFHRISARHQPTDCAVCLESGSKHDVRSDRKANGTQWEVSNPPFFLASGVALTTILACRAFMTVSFAPFLSADTVHTSRIKASPQLRQPPDAFSHPAPCAHQNGRCLPPVPHRRDRRPLRQPDVQGLRPPPKR